MELEKCQYYNNAQTACTLMIDDLSCIAVTKNGVLQPENDWGYGLNSKDSLWRYFSKTVLMKHPEVKGSIFFATQNHKVQNRNSGYELLIRDIDQYFKDFVHQILPSFELAFHGTTHGKYIDVSNNELHGNFKHEFEYVMPTDIPNLKAEIESIERYLEIRFEGGKYCGYKKNEHANRVIEELGFKWWASSAHMINKRHPDSKHSYWGKIKKILEIPTNVSGNLFNRTLEKKAAYYPLLSLAKALVKDYQKERYLQYLYDNGLIISVQEHFQNQRTDGKRQTPNVYDNIDSLNRIYSLLRGTDTWYASCSDIAHYLESFDYTQIIPRNDKSFEVKYSGRWNNMLLSVKSKRSSLFHVDTGKEFQGIYKKGCWVFNNIPTGVFTV